MLEVDVKVVLILSTETPTLEVILACCLVTLITGNDYELHSLFLAHSPLDLLSFVPGYGRLVDENALTGVIAADEAIAAPDVNPIDGPNSMSSKRPRVSCGEATRSCGLVLVAVRSCVALPAATPTQLALVLTRTCNITFPLPVTAGQAKSMLQI